MTDIVERLRKGMTDGTHLSWHVTPTHQEAADEIERLRNENELLRKGLNKIKDGYGPNHMSAFCRFTARDTLEEVK